MFYGDSPERSTAIRRLCKCLQALQAALGVPASSSSSDNSILSHLSEALGHLGSKVDTDYIHDVCAYNII